ncbi:type VII secretion integral membrane protein EccD [Micromonospora sp. HUAS LYJ1]|uniref:type VII secretion integral membrane protein EccD n=1 Tax=Micromonospora sp. HUAS LYJ1 TaxID=3061626 RepID=UPI002671E375|nr:type VII secretion integral membrane protein EccD [Micromonospora sp. HUAS LYJ1]WKU05347.1 type VII secretion integral membrane protein EccD [Micromonospora sp. HUAS LYJ1]
MTSAGDQLCRISVEGPAKRVDLAVPATTTVAALLPVLLQHTAGPAGADLAGAEESWVLQRLGGPPFDPAGTPESLDWLEGERLHLRPVVNQLPELHFDDIAEGIAEAVNKRADRWQAGYRRPLFIGVSAVVLALLTVVLLDAGPGGLRQGFGGALAVGLLVTAVLAAHLLPTPGLSTLAGIGACGLAAIVTADLVDGESARAVVTGPGLAAGAGAAGIVALLLVVVQAVWAPAVRYPVFLAIAGLSVIVVGVLGLRALGGLDAAGAAGLGATVLFALVLFAPNLVLRAGRLRGPQLPKTGSELQYDTEPYPAEDVASRANRAENYLIVLVVCVSVALPVLFAVILPAGGWASWAIVVVLSAGVLLRARVFLDTWQRVALTAGGSAGAVMVVIRASGRVTTGWLVLILILLTVLFVVTVLASIRPWPRRLLPIWEFTATVFDVVIAFAVLPVCLQLLHTYAWARGLFG